MTTAFVLPGAGSLVWGTSRGRRRKEHRLDPKMQVSLYLKNRH